MQHTLRATPNALDCRRRRPRPTTQGGPRPATAGLTRPGFTLIELMIVVVILGIVAAVVVPQFSNATLVARENTLKDELRYLRTQIMVYKAQHDDVPPGYPGGSTSAAPTEAAFVAQMTQFTNANSGTNATQSATFKFGPYLSKMSANPINGLNTVNVLADGAALPGAATNTYGWVYHPKTQTFLSDATGTGRDGVPYFSY